MFYYFLQNTHTLRHLWGTNLQLQPQYFYGSLESRHHKEPESAKKWKSIFSLECPLKLTVGCGRKLQHHWSHLNPFCGQRLPWLFVVKGSWSHIWLHTLWSKMLDASVFFSNKLNIEPIFTQKNGMYVNFWHAITIPNLKKKLHKMAEFWKGLKLA